MSREIKFRAWFELENKMVLPENLALSYEGEDLFDFAFDKEFPDPEGNVPGTLCFKLMQYTGLKDKNGKEIYEGDFVAGISYSDYKTENQVIFLNGCWMFGTWNAHEFFNRHQYIEVVGNIYENPELLEVAE